MANIDFDQLGPLLVKAARGQETQEQLSLELGSQFNIVNRWENGTRGIYWEDFLALAAYKQWPLDKALKEVTHFDTSPLPSAREVLQLILTPSSLEILIQSFSKQKLNRMSSGKSKLMLRDFLFILEKIFGRSERFLRYFVDMNEFPELAKVYETTMAVRSVVGADPAAAMLRLAISLSGYQSLPKHSDQYLAKLLGLDEEVIAGLIRQLQDAGAIDYRGEHYHLTETYVDSGARDKNVSRRLVNHWRGEIVQKVEDGTLGKTQLMSAYLLYATNDALEAKIFELCRKFYIDMSNLAVSGEFGPKDKIRFLNVDLFYPLEADEE